MYLVRLLIIGDSGVGKTSLLVRFNEDTFAQTQKTTIGVDYKAKEVVIKRKSTHTEIGEEGDGDGGEDHVKLQIWDTAGQERFRSMTSAFYNKALGVVLTFDVSHRDSFLALPSWISDIRRDASPSCIIVLCANKVDLDESKWQVRREEYTALANQHGFSLFEASGKSGQGVQDVFLELGRLIVDKNRGELQEVGGSGSPTTRPIVLTGGGGDAAAAAAVATDKQKKSRSSFSSWC
jgi:small GTP-binding protein